MKNVSKVLQDYSPLSSTELDILHNNDVPIDPKGGVQKSNGSSVPMLDYAPVEMSDDEDGLSNAVTLVEFTNFDEETGCTSFRKVHKTVEVEPNQIVSSSDSKRMTEDTCEELKEYKVIDKNNSTLATMSDSSNDSFIDVDQNNSDISAEETGLAKSFMGSHKNISNVKENLLNESNFNDPYISNHDGNHFSDASDALDESNLCEKVFDSTRMATDTCEELYKYEMKNENKLTDPIVPSSNNDFGDGQNDSNIHEIETEEFIVGPCQKTLSASEGLLNKNKNFISNHDTKLSIDCCDTIDEGNLTEAIFESTRRISDACAVLSEYKMTDKNDLPDATLSDHSNDNKYSNINEVETKIVESVVDPCQDILNSKDSLQSKNKLSNPCISNDANHTDSCDSDDTHYFLKLKVADPKTSNIKSKIKMGSVSAKRYSDGYIKLGVDPSLSRKLPLNPESSNVSNPGILFQGTKIDETNAAIKFHVTPDPLLINPPVTCKDNLNACPIVKPSIKKSNPHYDIPVNVSDMRVDASGNKCIMHTPLSNATNKNIQDSTIPLKQALFPTKELENATDPALKGKMPFQVKGRTFQSEAFCKKRDGTENAFDKMPASPFLTNKEMDLQMHGDSMDIVCPRPRKIRKKHNQKTVEESHTYNTALQNQNCSVEGIDVTEHVCSNNGKLHNFKTFNQSSECLSLKGSSESLFQPSVLPEIFSQNILDVVHNSNGIDCETPDYLSNAEFSNGKEASSLFEKYTYLGLDIKCLASNNLTNKTIGDCTSDSITLAHLYNECVTNSSKKCQKKSLCHAASGKNQINGTYAEYLQRKGMLKDHTL